MLMHSDTDSKLSSGSSLDSLYLPFKQLITLELLRPRFSRTHLNPTLRRRSECCVFPQPIVLVHVCVSGRHHHIAFTFFLRWDLTLAQAGVRWHDPGSLQLQTLGLKRSFYLSLPNEMNTRTLTKVGSDASTIEIHTASESYNKNEERTYTNLDGTGYRTLMLHGRAYGSYSTNPNIM
ncbi:hypothetical protein AAY473_039130 [Plecturocebus cupreus]